MLFNSIEFLIFFPIVTLFYFICPHKIRWILLLISSCIFYSYFIPIYILILFVIIIIDYLAGIKIEKSNNKKFYLTISLVANISILCFFKYYNFFLENLNVVSGFNVALLKFALPIGLSFHTFQAMSYTIEVYKGRTKAEKHLGLYALYVMFYPQLVAGPIERPQNILPQLRIRQKFILSNFTQGISLMIWGFFKKLVIADRLSVYVNIIFENPDQYHSLNLIIGAVFFSIQIYCDFSGYSDIAIGSARVMGFSLMTNFNYPYFAKSIKEFWGRWHISLSTWFRDYVYFPLGGNRISSQITARNTLIIFILSGFWHGANWTFIFWGLIHGILVVFESFASTRKSHFHIPVFLKHLFVCTAVTIAWIYFRAPSIDIANNYIIGIFTNSHLQFQQILKNSQGIIVFPKASMLFSALGIVYLFISEKIKISHLHQSKTKGLKEGIFTMFTLLIIIYFGIYHHNSFIYFQF